MDRWRAFDVLLPRRCLLCRAPSAANLCPGCDADLPAIGQACFRCGIPLDAFEGSLQGREQSSCVCGACIRRPPPYERVVAALNYIFPVTVLVQRFKFNRSFACGAVLSGRLLRALEERLDKPLDLVDLIVPVPLHPTRQFRRAFNQAEVLARDIGNSLGVSVAPRALRRNRRTPAQTGLPARERRGNLEGAFTARPLAATRVALVDDVMTTGTTVSECARALKRAGAGSVVVWVAARAE